MAAEEGETFAFEEFFRRKLAVVFSQDRFVVKEIELRGCTDHVQVNDMLGLGSEMRVSREGGVRGRSGSQVAGEKRTESSGAEGKAAFLEEGAAIEVTLHHRCKRTPAANLEKDLALEGALSLDSAFHRGSSG